MFKPFPSWVSKALIINFFSQMIKRYHFFMNIFLLYFLLQKENCSISRKSGKHHFIVIWDENARNFSRKLCWAGYYSTKLSQGSLTVPLYPDWENHRSEMVVKTNLNRIFRFIFFKRTTLFISLLIGRGIYFLKYNFPSPFRK